MNQLINLPFKDMAELQHEVRIPMAGTLGALELLKDKTLNQTQKDELLQVACEASERLWATLNQILNSPAKEIKTYKLPLWLVNSQQVVFMMN